MFILICSNLFFLYKNIVYRKRIIELKKENKTLSVNSQLFGIKVSNYFTSIKTNRIKFFNALPIDNHSIVFLGDSFFEYAEIPELFNNIHFKNRGVAGETTSEIKNRLNEILEKGPEKIIFEGGTNDITKDIPLLTTIKNIEELIVTTKTKSPNTVLYILEVPPKLNEKLNNHAKEINLKLSYLCSKNNVTLIKLSDVFSFENGKINSNLFCKDGIHFNNSGYLKFKETIQRRFFN